MQCFFYLSLLYMKFELIAEKEPKLENEHNSLNSGKIIALLKKIESLQSAGSAVYPAGLFPSQRFHTYLPYRREDNNVFFTALIAFTLKQLLPLLEPDQKTIAEGICNCAIQTYPLYKSRRGLMTYNFWQNTPQKHFYPGYVFHKLKFLALPDDADDTVLIFMTKPHTHEDVLWVKQELSKHANKSKAAIQNTFPQFKELRAYTTWFGKNMYLEFDFCVLCNVMYFVCSHKLPFSVHDYDTIAFLKQVIISDLHITNPFKVSASYPRATLILYHMSRLMAAFEIPELDALRPKITAQLQQLIKEQHHIIDQMLLAISIGRMTGAYPDVNYQLPLPFENYYFFNGGLLTAFETPITRKLAPHPFFHLKHTCEAYYLALAVEYEVLRRL